MFLNKYEKDKDAMNMLIDKLKADDYLGHNKML